MPIVRAAYRLSHAGGRAASRAALNYAVQRPGRDGQEGQRFVFDRSRDAVDLADVQGELRGAEGAFHYRLILNPGDGQSSVDLQEWTRDTMAILEERQGGSSEWWGVVHDDHASHSHVHVVAVVPHRLNVLDLDAIREEADQSFEHRRALERVLSYEAPIEDWVSELRPQRERARAREWEQEV